MSQAPTGYRATDKFQEIVFLDMFGDPVTNPKGWEKKSLVNRAGIGSSSRALFTSLQIRAYRSTGKLRSENLVRANQLFRIFSFRKNTM